MPNSPLATFLSDLRAPVERDPAADGWLDVVLSYPGFHAITIHRLVHALWRAGIPLAPRFIAELVHRWTGIDIHPGATIGPGFFIDHGTGVVIGGTAIIGENVTIYQGVTLGGTSLAHAKRHPTLGSNVTVGSGAAVLGDITIGDNVKIGANSVVVKDVPPNSTVVGIPGRVVLQDGKPLSPPNPRPHVDLPDPNAPLLAALADRIEALEARLAALQNHRKRAMSLKLYNTRTRTVEPFAPLRDGHVRMYVCGLTPSAEAHLGHARSFLFFDVLRRYLEHLNYTVTFVRNVTDIDDRSIARARETGESWSAIVGRHFDSFKASMRRLGVREPDIEPRATDFIEPIVAMIGELIAAQYAYTTSDGVYFAVKKFARYGALSHRNVDELQAGARIAVDEQKRDALDFALWKFAKPAEPSWESPWGAGRPGWHIECSAMARALLGEPFDIHGGGFDLIFPHHENEIAQSEALMPAPPMANVWMHGGLLMFDGKKMSKSLGNFEPLGALLDRHDPRAIRLLFLGTGYRKPMNFTEDAITGATVALDRLRKAYARFADGPSGDGVVAPFEERFFAALDDDMNTAGALGVLFEAAADQSLRGSEAIALFDTAARLFGIEGAFDAPPAAAFTVFDESFVARLAAALGEAMHLNGHSPEAAITAVIDARNLARASRDFALADRLRRALAEQRIVLTDNKDGTTSWLLEN